jgi:excisionase family DNA binding protein
MNSNPEPHRSAAAFSANSVDLRGLAIFEGIAITSSAGIRWFWFSADSEADAKDFCGRSGFALVGRAAWPGSEKTEPEAYTLNEVMEKLQLSRSSVYRLIARGQLKQLRGMSVVRVSRRSLHEYLSSSK